MSTLKTSKLSGIVDAKLGIKVNNRNLKANFYVDSSYGAPLSIDSGGNAQPGDYFWDSDNSSLKVYVNDSFGWTNVGLTDSSGAGPSNADTAFILGGIYYFSSGSGNWNVPDNNIEQINFETLGNATDFADFTITGTTDPYGYPRKGVSEITAGGDHNRIVMGAASVINVSHQTNDFEHGIGIHYITCATAANSTQFGSLQSSSYHNEMGGDGGNGVMHFRNQGGNVAGTTLQQVTIQTTGDATDFINLQMLDMKWGGVSTNDTRGIAFGGRRSNYYQNYIDYFTPGNASVAAADFGDLITGNNKPAVTNDNLNRTVYADMVTGTLSSSSGSISNTINYIDTATPSNSVDFGDLTVSQQGMGASASNTRAVFFGGQINTGNYADTTICYVTIATPGNASDFGDCSPRRDTAGSEGIG